MSDPVGTNDPEADSGAGEPTTLPGMDGAGVDLDAVERDLDGVESALGRLDDGTYWTDEVTGEEIPDHVLADDPTARRT